MEKPIFPLRKEMSEKVTGKAFETVKLPKEKPKGYIFSRAPANWVTALGTNI